jgi:hypothetical protein
MGSNVSCDSYKSCVDARRKRMRFPADSTGLYEQGIYDRQTADRKCYEKGPIDYVEGFNCRSLRNLPWSTILQWAVVILLLVLAYMYWNSRTKEVNINVETAPNPATPIEAPAVGVDTAAGL